MSADTNGAQDSEVFDLDVLERDAAPVPFRFRLGGQEWTMADPGAMDWKMESLVEKETPLQLFERFLGPDQWTRFKDLDAAAWKLKALFEAWGAHYGIAIPELQASPPSSAPTGKRSRPTFAITTASGSPTSPPAT